MQKNLDEKILKKARQRIAVCAGNYEEFSNFLCEKNGETDIDYIYADERIRGTRLNGYVIYGSFYKRKNRDDIFREVKSRIIPY